jgi:hypothetical protein
VNHKARQQTVNLMDCGMQEEPWHVQDHQEVLGFAVHVLQDETEQIQEHRQTAEHELIRPNAAATHKRNKINC